MLRVSARVLLAAAAGSALAIGAVLCAAAPASATTTVDPSPVRTIGGPLAGFDVGILALAAASDGTTYVAQQYYDPNSFYTEQSRIEVFAAHAAGNTTPEYTIYGSDTGLSDPTALAIDANGDLWVANQGGTLANQDWSGTVEEFLPGSKGDAKPNLVIGGDQTGLSQPDGVTVGNGSVYVTDYDGLDYQIGDAVEQFSEAALSAGVNNVPATSAFWRADYSDLDSYDYAVGLQPNKSIVVAQYNGSTYAPFIDTFSDNSSGAVTPQTSIVSSDLDQETLAVDRLGNIYSTSTSDSAVIEFSGSASGSSVAPTSIIGGLASGISNPGPIAFDSDDNLYVSNISDKPGQTTVTVYKATLAIASVTPSPAGGGEPVVINGYGFTKGDPATVTFGGVPATDVTVTSADTITATVPAHAAGKVDVVVTQDGATTTGVGAFTFGSSLATTGVDPAPGVCAGAFFLLVGAALLVVRRRMKRTAKALRAH